MKDLKISIYGDSLSTFENYVPEDALFYYPIYSQTVKSVDKTWWHILLNKTGFKLHTNVSYAGSCVCGDNSSCGVNDIRLKKLIINNEAPDIIIILLGINDVVSGIDEIVFKNTYIEMINKIKSLCPKSKILITNLHYETASDGSGNAPESYIHIGLRDKYNIIFNELAKELNLPLIDIAKLITKKTDSFGNKKHVGDNIHFNDEGMKVVAEEAYKVLMKTL